MKAPEQKFCTTSAAGTKWTQGLRKFFEYRDLGISEATGGAYNAHVIRRIHIPEIKTQRYALSIPSKMPGNLMIMAVRLGEITFIAPFFFSAIPFAVILGYLFWGDTLDGPATLGVVAIITAGWLTARKAGRPTSPG